MSNFILSTPGMGDSHLHILMEHVEETLAPPHWQEIYFPDKPLSGRMYGTYLRPKEDYIHTKTHKNRPGQQVKMQISQANHWNLPQIAH